MKERLVGAAVLMAAAIILIPEMLSGPPHDAPAQPERSVGETPLKTYTIDLSKPPGTDAAIPQVSKPASAEPDTRAPPPEQTPARTDSAGESSQPLSAAPAESESAASEPSLASAAKPGSPTESTIPESPKPAPQIAPPLPTAVSPPAVPAEAEKSASAAPPAIPMTRGWAVQLGSFSSAARAEQLAQQLRGAGHSAFVMPVKTSAATLYRVRVGPMKERSGAEQALAKVRQFSAGAAVVAHP